MGTLYAVWTALKGFSRPIRAAVSSRPKIAAGLVAALLYGAGMFWAGRASVDTAPEIAETARTDTVRLTRTITRRETIRTTVPNRVTIYERDTVVQYRDTSVTIPVTLAGGFRMARPEPLQVGSETVTYAAFDPGSGRWTRQTYAVPEQRWNISATLTASQSIRAIRERLVQPSLAAELALGYRDWTLVGAAGYSLRAKDPFATVGLEWTFFEK